MIKWFYYWDEWRKAYWSLIDKHPEMFAFLHRMYLFQHVQAIGRRDSRDVSIRFNRAIFPSSVWRKLKQRITGSSRSGSSAIGTIESETVDVQDQVDILFYTFANRATCLGVGEKLFDKIREQKLEITGAFYQNERDRILTGEQHHGNQVVTLKAKPSAKGVVRFIQLLPFVYLFGLKSKAVAKFIFLHPLMTLINLLKITTTSASMERMLDRLNPRIILSCNEQGGGDASILFALAKKYNIHTIQYMHAIPTKQFVPFICDEYWSWSEITTRMLLGDEQDSRAINLGSLEHENRASASIQCDVVPSEERRVLFLAQMGMDEAWDIRSNSAGMHTFCDGIRLFKGAVKVRVREHPVAGSKEREMLLASMEKIPFELTTKSTPLAQDVEWATHVYTICSNAIFAALLGGKPAYLFWNQELDGIYGRAFLPESNVLGSSTEFVDSLNSTATLDGTGSILEQVLGSTEAQDRAVNRIKHLITAC